MKKYNKKKIKDANIFKAGMNLRLTTNLIINEKYNNQLDWKNRTTDWKNRTTEKANSTKNYFRNSINYERKKNIRTKSNKSEYPLKKIKEDESDESDDVNHFHVNKSLTEESSNDIKSYTMSKQRNELTNKNYLDKKNFEAKTRDIQNIKSNNYEALENSPIANRNRNEINFINEPSYANLNQAYNDDDSNEYLNYNQLDIRYKESLNNLAKLKEELLIKNEKYIKLKNNYDNLNIDYEQMIEKYNKLEKNYLKIKDDFNKIKDSPFFLKEEEYDILYKGFNDLSQENEDLKKKLKISLSILKEKPTNFSNLVIDKQKIFIKMDNNNNLKNENDENIIKVKNYKTPDDNEENSKKVNVESKTKEKNYKTLDSLNSDKDSVENSFKLLNDNKDEENLLNINNKMPNKKENEDFIKLINELLDENNELKSMNENNIEIVKGNNFNYNKLKKEYEKLKEELNKLKINNNSSIIKENYFYEDNINKKQNTIINFIFPKIFLYNDNSFFYMNSILQFLLHIEELNNYFLNEYPNDCLALKRKNEHIKSKGDISLSFYNIVNYIYEINKNISSNNKRIRNKYKDKKNKDLLKKHLKEFKNLIINYNSPFTYFEPNNHKNFIIFLLNAMHEELNYLGGNKFELNYKEKVNHSNKLSYFNDFNLIFNRNNYSIISRLFYGTFEETIKCISCNNINYNIQKFQLISFETNNYGQKKFNIYDGFEDNENVKLISGNNKLYCNVCEKSNDSEYCYKIIDPPFKLLININYSEDKEKLPIKIEYDEIIDITKFVNFSYKCPVKYRINCVCSYLNNSTNNKNYITFCRDRENDKWYKFDNNSVMNCDKNAIYIGNPNLLLYEKL